MFVADEIVQGREDLLISRKSLFGDPVTELVHSSLERRNGARLQSIPGEVSPISKLLQVKGVHELFEELVDGKGDDGLTVK